MFKTFYNKTKQIFQGWFRWGEDTLTKHFNPVAYERHQVCKDCMYNVLGICSLCGCIIKAKTRVDFPLDVEGKSIGGCPVRKW